MTWYPVSVKITAESPERLRLIRETLAEKTRPEALYANTLIVHQRYEKSYYRLGDYFESIEVSEHEGFLRVRFVPEQNVSAFWKDLVVRIVSWVGAVAEVEFEKGVDNTNEVRV